ncbi:MAG TPA: ATP-binding protein [Phycisphaerae bacterium]|nr:ATP-binding protein [Phycisphaerae bacterium]
MPDISPTPPADASRPRRQWLGGRSMAGIMQGWYGGLLGIVLIAFGVATYVGLRRMAYQRVDSELERAIQLLAAGIHPQRGGPGGGGVGGGGPGRGPDGGRGDRGAYNPDDPGDRTGRHPRPDDPNAWPDGTDWAGGPGPGQGGGFGHGGPWRGGPGGPPDATIEIPPNTAGQFGGVTDDGSMYAIVWRPDGSILRKSMAENPATLGIPDPGPIGPPAGAEMGRRGPPIPQVPEIRQRGDFREATLHGPFDTRLVVGESLAPEESTLRHAALLLLAAGAGVLVVGLAGGWAVSRRVVRPIQRMTAIAGKISATNLSRRMEPAAVPGELKELAGVLNDMFARLDEAFAQQTRFTADASHELRTPLAVIHTQLQLALSRERSAAEYHKTLATCLRASGRMKGLVDSLLLLAGADAGRLSLDHRRFDLSDVARDCTAMVATLAAEKHVTLESDLAPAAVLGDPARMEQVVTNLLTNAIRYNRDGGHVKCSVAVEGASASSPGDAVFRVTDTGVGIPPEHVGHLFERFYRVDPARSREAGGNGLGLAICKSIVEAHRGHIEVTSELDAGTTFTVRLPAAAPAPAPLPA